MLKRQRIKRTKETKVTFVIPHNPEQARVYLAGDFNDWDISGTQLVKRRNNTRSVNVTLKPGRYAFRYYTDNGDWFNDDAADGYEPSEMGSQNCIIVIE